MTEDKSNVIQFPKSSAAPVAQELIRDKPTNMNDLPQKAAQSQEFVMKLIEQNRKKGIEQLGSKVEALGARDLHPDPKTESALRDVQGALNGALVNIEAGSSLLDYVKHDLMAVIQNMEGFGQQGFQTAAHLQCLISLLVNKGMITHDEMKETWDALIKPKAEALAAGQQPEEDKPA